MNVAKFVSKRLLGDPLIKFFCATAFYFVYAITYVENKYALSPGIEPRHTAPEADALSIELGEPVYDI